MKGKKKRQGEGDDITSLRIVGVLFLVISIFLLLVLLDGFFNWHPDEFARVVPAIAGVLLLSISFTYCFLCSSGVNR